MPGLSGTTTSAERRDAKRHAQLAGGLRDPDCGTSPLRRFARGLGPEGVEGAVDEHGLDCSGVMPDLVIAPARYIRRGVLQPIDNERALAGQRRGSRIIPLEPAHQRTEHRVMTQVVVVDEV